MSLRFICQLGLQAPEGVTEAHPPGCWLQAAAAGHVPLHMAASGMAAGSPHVGDPRGGAGTFTVTSAVSYWSHRPTLIHCGRALHKTVTVRKGGNWGVILDVGYNTQ